MLNKNTSGRRFEHNFLSLVVLGALLATAVHRGVPDAAGAQTATHKPGQPPNCAAVPLKTSLPHRHKNWRVKAGETYANAPKLSLSVDEEGTVSGVKLIRSSGIHDIDGWVLQAVTKWRYKPAHGCGVRSVEVDVVIDFDHDHK